MADKKPIAFADERKPCVVHYDIELDDARLKPYPHRTYHRIARRCAGALDGRCFESIDSMAEACEMSRAQLVRALRVLVERRMVARRSVKGMPSTYVLLDKSIWMPHAEWLKAFPPKKKAGGGSIGAGGGGSHRARGVALTEPGGGSIGATKKIKKKTKKVDNISLPAEPAGDASAPPLEAGPGHWMKPFFDYFQSLHEARWGMPAQINGRDAKALKTCRDALRDKFSYEAWQQACVHYFQSPARPSHTAHHLAANFAAYHEAPTDRYNVSTKEGHNANSNTGKQPYKSTNQRNAEGTFALIADALQRERAAGNDAPEPGTDHNSIDLRRDAGAVWASSPVINADSKSA